MSTRRHLTTETIHLLVNNFGGMLIGLIGTILITRALGPEARGSYAWILSVSSIGVSIALLAQYNSVRKLGTDAAQEQAWPTLIGSLCTLNLAGGLLTLPLLGWALMQPVGQSHTALLLLSWLTVPLLSTASVTGAFIHLRRRLSATLLSTFMPRIALTALIVLGWFLQSLTLETAVSLNVVLAFLTFVVFLFWLDIPLKNWRINTNLLQEARHFLGAGWMAGIALFIMPKLPLILLPNYATMQDIGHFSLATTLLDISLMVPAAATSVLISHFTRHTRSGTGQIQGKRKALYALTMIVTFMAVAGFVLSPYLVPLLFGQEFTMAAKLFQWLLPALVLQAPIAILSSTTMATGNTRGIWLPPMAGLVTSLLLCLIWLPSHGVLGACGIVIGAYAVQLTALVYVAGPRTFLFTKRKNHR